MAEAGGISRRRRTRSHHRLPSPFRHPLAGKLVAALVAVLAVFDLVWTASALHNSVLSYGVAGPGMSKDDVLYAMGEPSRRRDTSPGSAVWLYQQDNSLYRLDFGPSKLVDRVSCNGGKANIGDCPATLGLHLGSGEDEIWNRLGAPDRQGYHGTTKFMIYRSLGLTFYLQRFQIVAIDLDKASGSYAYLERLARVLVP